MKNLKITTMIETMKKIKSRTEMRNKKLNESRKIDENTVENHKMN